MTDQEKDKLIMEALEECFHEYDWDRLRVGGAVCIKCGHVGLRVILATPEGFFWTWPRLRKDKKLFKEFIQDYLTSECEWHEPDPWFLPFELVDFTHFRDTLAEFLEGRRESV
jgi:hypothetical protein